MKVLRTFSFWLLVSAAGYWVGLLLSQFVTSEVLGSLALSLTAVFALASFSLAFVFRLVDTAPPENLDRARRQKWIRRFDRRWRMLWIRLLLLILATGLSRFSGAILSKSVSFSADGVGEGLLGVAIAIGITVAVLSILEIFWIRAEVRKARENLEESQRKRELLMRLVGHTE
jgi:hypothetical protein